MLVDTDVLTEIQYHVVEPPDGGATMASGLWLPTEVLHLLNQRQRRFILDTGLVVRRAPIPTPANTSRLPLPQDWIVTRRATWTDPAGHISELPRSDSFHLDQALIYWPFLRMAKPSVYVEKELPLVEIQVSPTSYNAGVLTVHYIAEPTLLTATGTTFSVPDEFVAVIKWGTLADMLWKPSRAQDPERARYCEMRYQEGVEATRQLLTGWV
jgi:hypothetical protein